MMVFGTVKYLYRFVQALKILLAFYLIVAVSHTTNRLFVAPLRAGLSILINRPMTSRSLWMTSLTVKPGINRPTEHKQTVAYDLESRFLKFSDGETTWESSMLALEHGLGHGHPIAVDEELTLSKAFSTSMKPTKIIPYLFRASGVFEPDDITITTLVTSSRFGAFSQLIERYQGPISVTIHARNTTDEIRTVLRSLKHLYDTSEHMATYVDVHLVIDFFDRQFNTWRNIARLFARTDYVMMLDVDFYLCTDFRTAVRRTPHIMNRLRGGSVALVVPAFEYTKYTEGLNPAKFPRDKGALVDLVKSKRLGMFHASWAPGHNSTDYKRYYAAPPGDVYKVTQYTPAYEPYVIVKKEGPPWCDERFVGYGGNKAACLYEMYISGISYFVLADHFIIHQSHRYLKRYNENGLINSTQSLNALQECKGRRSYARLAEVLFMEETEDPS
ncbi:hypothetical protein H0H93_015328 [Arthromyces matolae]|nr:hypothetical protein H0H93_015328 [Arthromyces matolae]